MVLNYHYSLFVEWFDENSKKKKKKKKKKKIFFFFFLGRLPLLPEPNLGRNFGP